MSNSIEQELAESQAKLEEAKAEAGLTDVPDWMLTVLSLSVMALMLAGLVWVGSWGWGYLTAPGEAAPPPNYTELVIKSEDYDRFGDRFERAAKHFVENGICSEENFINHDGFWRSSKSTHNNPTYFIACGPGLLVQAVRINIKTMEYDSRDYWGRIK